MNEQEVQRGAMEKLEQTKYKHVVVWDPKGEYWEGAVVSGKEVNALETRGVVLLPCIPELFFDAGFAGYAKRAWGSGWPLDSSAPRAACPILLYYPGEPYRRVHWKARLVGTPGQGVPLRFAAGETRGNIVRPVVQDVAAANNAVDVASLGAPDAHGGWTVGGTASLGVAAAAAYGFALYGCARGMRVAWLAATLTP